MTPEQEQEHDPEVLTIRWVDCQIYDDEGFRDGCCCDCAACCRWVTDDGREFFEILDQ